MPTVCFAAAAGLLVGRGVLSVMIVALLTSWALSQALAYLGYMRLGQGVPVQAQRVLLAGLGAGIVGVLVAMDLVSVAVPVLRARCSSSVWAWARTCWAPPCCWCWAPSALLFAALAPGVLGATAFLLLGRPAHLEHVAWAALAATPLLALGLAVARTSPGLSFAAAGAGGPARSRSQAGRPRRTCAARCRAPDSGWSPGGLLVFPVAVGMPGHGGVQHRAR